VLVQPSRVRARTWLSRPLGLSRDNAWLAVSTLLLGASIGFYQYVIPLYVAELGASPDQVGLALAIGNSGGIVGLVVGGAIVNRFAYRPQIVLSWLVSVVSGIAFVAAWSWEIVALGLLLSTLSLIGIPAYNAYIVLARDGQDAAEALTIVYVGFTAGSAITPALGGWIIANAGMRPMFWVSLACVVASTIASAVIRERPREAEASPESIGVRRKERWLVAPLRAYRNALAERSIQRLLLVASGLNLSTFVAVSLLPNYLHARLGLAPATVSALGTGAAIVGVVASLGLARASRQVGAYRALALSELLLVLGFGLTLLAPTLGGWSIVAGSGGFALRGGVQAQQAVARAAVAASASGARLGPSFALLSVVFNAALTMGPALAGPLYTLDPALPLVVGLVVGLPIAVWLLVQRPTSKPTR
jgi:predicted MFS family arabinose efflux permease